MIISLQKQKKKKILINFGYNLNAKYFQLLALRENVNHIKIFAKLAKKY